MKHKINKHIVYLSLTSLLGVIVICALLAYGTNFNDPLSRMVKTAFPAVIVGGRMVSIQTWDQYQELANKFNPENESGTTGDVLIRQLRQQSLIASLKITVTPQDLTDELNFIKSSQEDEYNRILREYFDNDERLFQERIIVPRVYDKLLRIYHNTDPNSLRMEHKEANTILEKIKQGQEFESFLSQSDDLVSAQLEGSLGFVAPTDILPELSKAIQNVTISKVHDELVISRLGYHILYVEETSEEDGQKIYHVKHILIAADGFEQWQDAQLNKIKVWKVRN